MTTNEKGGLPKKQMIDKFSDKMGNLFNFVPMNVHLLSRQMPYPMCVFCFA